MKNLNVYVIVDPLLEELVGVFFAKNLASAHKQFDAFLEQIRSKGSKANYYLYQYTDAFGSFAVPETFDEITPESFYMVGAVDTGQEVESVE